jgi:hypothetical protein
LLERITRPAGNIGTQAKRVFERAVMRRAKRRADPVKLGLFIGGQGCIIGLVVTTVPKVPLRNTFYINELFGAFCYKQLKSMNILLLSA